MKISRTLLLGLLPVLVTGCSLFERPPATPVRAARFQKAIAAVYPALVRIDVVTPSFQGGREVRHQGGGSGVIVSPDGYVITNHHVAGKATLIVCVLSDKREVRAERVGTDPLADICVLKLAEPGPYPFAAFGDSAEVVVGDTVLAMGSPWGISPSVTAGIVSNADLIIPYSGLMRLDGENVGALVKWIAHDAPTYPGNSGGPLVNPEGEVVGISELGMGLSAAIPGNLAKAVSEQLIAQREARRSTVGLLVQPLLKSSGRMKGVLVAGVVPGSPAEAAGLLPGDVILSYDGEPVTARFQEDLPVFNRLVFSTPVGAEVVILVDRDGEEKTLSLHTDLRTPARADSHEVAEWGMTAADLTEEVAKLLKRTTTDGVFVRNIRPGGPCAEAKPSLQGADVITAVGGQPVRNSDELFARTAEIVKDQDEPVPTLVAFDRKNEHWLTIVKIGIREIRDRSPEARKAWLAVSSQVLTTDLAEALGLAGRTGVRLTAVFEGRSADTAGLRVGDVITAIDGDAVRAVRPGDVDVFPAMVRRRRVGQTVDLTVHRDGEELTIPVELERSPRATREMKRYQDLPLGFTVRDLSDEDRRTDKIAEQIQGPLVTEVESGSLAAIGNLRTGDIILSVNDVATPDTATLKKVMGDLHEQKPGRVVFFVRRNIHTQFVEADTPWLEEKE